LFSSPACPIIAVIIPTYDIFVSLNFVNSFVVDGAVFDGHFPALCGMDRQELHRQCPLELEERRLTDGAGTWRTLRHITAPLCVPGLLVIAIYTFHPVVVQLLRAFILLANAQAACFGDDLPVLRRAHHQLQRAVRLRLIFTAVPVVLYVLLSKRHGRGLDVLGR